MDVGAPEGVGMAAPGWPRAAARRLLGTAHTPVPAPARRSASRALPNTTGATGCAAARAATATPHCSPVAPRQDQPAAGVDTAGEPGGRPGGTVPADGVG